MTKTMLRLLLLYFFIQFVWGKPDMVPVLQTGINFPNENSAEFAKKRLGLLGNHPDVNLEIQVHKIGRTTSIPESFDARVQWPDCREIIDNIRDQGNCASSWAFAPVEVMSDRLCIETNATKKFEFSPQDLISCCPYCGYGCYGGNAFYAWDYWKTYGLVSGGDFHTNKGCKPYEGLAYLHNATTICKNSCTNEKYNSTYKEDRHTGFKYYSLLPGNVEQMQMEIMTNGPIQASFEVFTDFMNYTKGVYHYVTGEHLGGHAVKIIGWGTEYDVPYWLVANSWGSDWASLNGYFKIRRGRNDCGIEGSILAGKATEDNSNSPGSSAKMISPGIMVLLGGLIFYFVFD